MPELDPFDTRLEHAVHAYADSARTNVDAGMIARRVAGERRRPGAWQVLGREVPVPVSMLLLLVLLLTMLIWTVAGGGVQPRRAAVPVERAPQASMPAFLDAPAMRETTDGLGDEVLIAQEVPSAGEISQRRTGDIVSLAGTFTIANATNDQRFRGTATLDFQADLPLLAGTATGFGAGPVRGTYRLDGPAGAWEGTCLGTILDEPLSIAGSCWLAGSGDYAGQTSFRMFTWRFATPWDPVSGWSEGIVYPAPPPSP